MSKRLERFEALKDEMERVIKPFVKLKIYKPEGVSPQDHAKLPSDPDFRERLEKLVSLYIKSRKEGFFILILPVKLSPDGARKLEDNKGFIERVNKLAKEMAGKDELDSTD